MHSLFLIGLIIVQLICQASSEGISLSSQQLKEGLDRGLFDVLIDVRTQREWDDGHIHNATQLFNLASRGVQPTKILGCKDKDCAIAVYCTIGVRAGKAINKLVNEFGYKSSNLYNGQGIDQWQEAGYSLVNTEEVPSNCNEPGYQCKTCNSPDEEIAFAAMSSTTTNMDQSNRSLSACTKDENGVIQFEASSGVRGALVKALMVAAVLLLTALHV